MKILKLRFSNLNSVYGECKIDFTNPVYQSDGIFAITGPTGSGKTTIMDAICLALYGQTPRLGKISQGSCEIMSRKTGECFSEVEFESSKGRFLCHWSQKRSYLKPDGNLQLPKHEIADASTGDILESARTLVLHRVEEATGMDFEQFTRSIMLAQGGFAAFLEAKPTERAPILEQITGTEIYSRISAKVFEKTKEERNILDSLCAGIEGIALLSEDELESLKAKRENKKKSSDELTEKIREYETSLLWLGRIKELNNQILKLEEEKKEVFADEKRFADVFLRLEKAQRASGLEGVYTDFININELAEKSRTEYESAKKEIEKLRLTITDLCDKSTHAEEKLSELKKILSLERETIKSVFELDLKIDSETRNHLEYKRRYEALLDRKKQYEENISDLNNSLRITEEQLKSRTEYLKNHQKDIELSEILGVAEEKASIFSDIRESIKNKEVCLDKILSEKEQAGFLLEEQKKAFEAKTEDCKRAEIKCRDISLKLSEILNKRTFEELRNSTEILQANILIIQRLCRISERKKQCLSDKNTVLQENIQIISEADRTAVLIENLSKEIETEERLTVELEEKKMLLIRIKSLEKQREELIKGEPCPLCGSLTHPYSAGIIQETDENSVEITKQRQKINSLKDSLTREKTELAKLKDRCDRNKKRAAEIDKELISADSEMASELKKAGLSHDECIQPAFFKDTETELETELQNLKDLLKIAEEEKSNLKEAQNHLSSEKEDLHNTEKLFNSAENNLKSLTKDESGIKSEISQENKTLIRHLDSLKNILNNFGETADSGTKPEEISLILKSLTGRKEEFSKNHSEKENLSKAVEALLKDIKTTKKGLGEAEAESLGVFRDLTDSKDLLERYKDERYRIYGDKDPKAEEEKLGRLVNNAEKTADAIKELKNSSEGSLKSKLWQKDTLETEKTRYSSTLMAKEMIFFEKLSEAGFSDLEEFTDSQLPAGEISHLSSLKDRISQRKNSNEAMISDRKQSLAKEMEKSLTEKTEPELKSEKESLESENNTLLSDIGGIDARLGDNETQKIRQREKLDELEVQKEICSRWERLNTLIGSSDGKKFRNFAQGLTFEIMIANANRQLERMSDRYILMHSPEIPLELCVIDNYQAGEMRSTRNLSGGESFIVSLALALGLSNMASQNVRVDSLFLDEGFGTLDEDSLETALETLSGLRQDEKLIGIISHVSAIKERIPAKIEVVKRSGGRSILKGPGCTHKS